MRRWPTTPLLGDSVRQPCRAFREAIPARFVGRDGRNRTSTAWSQTTRASVTLHPDEFGWRWGISVCPRASVRTPPALSASRRQDCLWWKRRESNSRHPQCKRGALPSELRPHNPTLFPRFVLELAEQAGLEPAISCVTGRRPGLLDHCSVVSVYASIHVACKHAGLPNIILLFFFQHLENVLNAQIPGNIDLL